MGPPSIFSLGKSMCFIQKGSLLCSGELAFCIKGVPFMSQEVSVFMESDNFFYQKVSESGHF